MTAAAGNAASGAKKLLIMKGLNSTANCGSAIAPSTTGSNHDVHADAAGRRTISPRCGAYAPINTYVNAGIQGTRKRFPQHTHPIGKAQRDKPSVSPSIAMEIPATGTTAANLAVGARATRHERFATKTDATSKPKNTGQKTTTPPFGESHSPAKKLAWSRNVTVNAGLA